MRNKKVSFLLVFVVVCLILSLSSCKRNNKSDSFVSSLITSNNFDVEPLVTVSDPNAVKETATTEEVNVSSLESASSADSQVSTSTQGPVLSDTSTEESEKVSAVILPEVPTLVMENQELYVVEDEIENALHSDDVPLIDTVFSYKGIESEIKVFSTFARITLPEGTTDDDIALCATLLCSAYPEETKYITYEKVDGCIILLYPRCDTEYLSDIVDVIFEEGKMYIDSLMPEVEKSDEEETFYTLSFTLYGDIEAKLKLTPSSLVFTRNRALTADEFNRIRNASLKFVPELDTYDIEISELGVSFTFEELDSSALSDLYSRLLDMLYYYSDGINEKNAAGDGVDSKELSSDSDKTDNNQEEVIATVESVTEKGRKVLTFEAGINGSVYYDVNHNQLRATVDGRLASQIADKFALGIKGGYDWGNYVSLMGYMEYNVTKKIYLFAGAGYRYDLDSISNYSSFIVEAGVGFEHNIVSTLFVFGEVSVKYAPLSYSKITPTLSLGLNYKFSF